MDALLGIIAIGGIVSVAEADLRGEQRGWLAGLADGVRAWPRVFATRLVGGLLLILAAIFFVLPAIYLGVRYSLSDAAAIVERRAGTTAINRSMALTRDRFFVFLGMWMVTMAPLLLVSGVIFLPLAFFPEIDNWLVSAALTCVVDLVEVWMTLVFVAAYVQCRFEERQAEVPQEASSEANPQGSAEDE